MPSPFPGMDPYLETPKLWPAFQHQLLACLYQILLPGLVDRYRARVGTRTYVSEMPLFTSVVREQYAEEYIEIRNRTDSKLVTLLEVVSPANKTTPAGRQAYLDAPTGRQPEGRHRRDRPRHAGQAAAHLLPRRAAGVRLRGHRDALQHTDRYEIYTSTLQKKLPKFKLPLAADDRDALLDLQAAFGRAYDLGTFANQIDYKAAPPPDVPFTDAHRAWAEELLKQMKLR